MQFVHLRSDRTIVWSRLGECRRTVANVENVLFYLFEKTSFDRVDLVPIQTLQSWLQRNASHMTPSCVVLFDESPLFHPQTSASLYVQMSTSSLFLRFFFARVGCLSFVLVQRKRLHEEILDIQWSFIHFFYFLCFGSFLVFLYA